MWWWRQRDVITPALAIAATSKNVRLTDKIELVVGRRDHGDP
jgi:hypothetical protein